MNKCLRSIRFMNTSVMSQVQEVSIPVPWGKIRGKWWGSTKCKPILCIHGLRDNCGSFDKLIPLLRTDENISFLAIDLPGHGFSTPFPRGMIYNFMNFIILVQQIYEYFNFSKLSFLGHSLGAMISFTSTLIHPEKVDFVICIDALQPLLSTVSKETVRNSVGDFIKYSKFNDEPPAYSREEILEKTYNAYHQMLDEESVICLLERNIVPSTKFPGKYVFTLDPMLKVRTMFNWTHKQLLDDAATINNPIQIFEAKQDYAKKYRKNFYELRDVMRKNNKDCSFHAMEGPHHLHLKEESKIAILIKAFLSQHYKSESSNLKDFSIFSPIAPSLLNDKTGRIVNKL